MTRPVLFAGVLLLAATGVRAQQPAFDAQTQTQIEQIAEAVATRGLPPDPVITKARFAALMHAPAPKIVSVARAVADRLEVARDALSPRPTAGDIKAGEDALSAGVTPDALRLVRSVRPDRPVAVPLGLLAQLVATGVSVPRAAQIVTDLMRRGADNRQLVALGNDVNADVALGEPADASLDVRTQALDAVLGAASGTDLTATANAPGQYTTGDVKQASGAGAGRTSRPRKP